MFELTTYYTVAAIMTVLAVITFIALLRIDAPYGMMFNSKWGPAINNRLGWVLMEAPVVAAMILLWALSPRRAELPQIVMTCIFLIHYFQRTFIFPFLMKGKSRMPVIIPAMGAAFNIINAYLIGGWFFYTAPADYYSADWLSSPLFILGCVIFLIGMVINIQSDSIIRHLRKPGDTRHYIPRGGMFRFVTSANYLGELTEWLGFAILSWSIGGAVFFIWTFANLAPRARTLHRRYCSEFGNEYASLHRRYLIPFIW
ncbi:MAG: DUF1295 domain-containing protein [Muribaculum sp.]|nr:DUF1295 domain-containing protein [Muribaculum sp.]